MPENEEAAPTAGIQQDVAGASEKLSCRTRLMGPLLILGGLVALAQAKPAAAALPADRRGTLPADRNGRCPPGYYYTGRGNCKRQ
jgi:hypothetical protein